MLREKSYPQGDHILAVAPFKYWRENVAKNLDLTIHLLLTTNRISDGMENDIPAKAKVVLISISNTGGETLPIILLNRHGFFHTKDVSLDS